MSWIAALPLGPLDASFARLLTWLAPRVSARACEHDPPHFQCEDTTGCGTCDCPQGAGCGQLLCDACPPHSVCECFCPPPPIC